MANPKITVTLTVDQSVMDDINAHTAALNRYCDAQSAKVVLEGKSPVAPSAVDETPQVAPENPLAAPIPMNANTGAGAAPVYPVADTVPSVTPVMPIMPVTPTVAPEAPVMPVQAAVIAQQPFALPTSPAAEITIETLMRAGVDLMNRGVNAAAVLTEFGVQALTELPKEQYPALAARLRQLGANI